MRNKLFKPVVSRELYTQQALERVFPGGEWVQRRGSEGYQGPGKDLTSPSNTEGDGVADVAPSSSSLTIIGGTKYDEDSLAYFFSQHPDYELVTGAGRGVESSLNVDVRIQPDTERFGKFARKVNVEQVLCHSIDSPLLLVGSGERVKQARDWLKRTRSTREVIELP